MFFFFLLTIFFLFLSLSLSLSLQHLLPVSFTHQLTYLLVVIYLSLYPGPGAFKLPPLPLFFVLLFLYPRNKKQARNTTQNLGTERKYRLGEEKKRGIKKTYI
ncbi:hypothetical protein F5X96DRAFT_628630 [Biscogniauxia mediterranea]|nr:hypothetical protein F5X96DRAFT_628630 [Biscogniauxia mediterranea]